MMNCIIRKQFRIIFRSGLYRFSLLFTGVIVFGMQLFLQGDYLNHVLSGLNVMPSFIAYENQRLGAMMQVFFMFFLVGMMCLAEKRWDTREVVYARSESNGELLGGYFVALLASLFVEGIWIALSGMFVHLFFSYTPFALCPYLFYFFTMTMPAMVFYTGLSFLVYGVVREQFVGLVILLVLFFLNVIYLDGCGGGWLDPLGIYLPNVFSNVTGHPDMLPYLMQRGSWLLLGVGCYGLSVLGFERIPNLRRWKWVFPGVCFLVGVVLGSVFFLNYRKDRNAREMYKNVYVSYAENECSTVERYDIHIDLEGNRMRGVSRMQLVNQTGKRLPEVLLYLNPRLEVLTVREGDHEIKTQRECQVVRLQREMSPADTIEIVVTYAGGIDERVCYLDVPDEMCESTGRSYFLNCRYGKHYAYLSREYTLLLPECLWYPVATPPVNPKKPYEVVYPFSEYKLTVSGSRKQMVVSQGKRHERNGQVVFEPETPLQGITLCTGDYLTFGTTVDSVRYEMIVFRKNSRILRGLSHVRLEKSIRELRDKAEEMGGRSYPYTRFMMIETPLAFTSYYRGQRGGHEFVQPEILFVPERGVGYWKNVSWNKQNQIAFSQNWEMISGGGMQFGEAFHRMTEEQQENEIVHHFLDHFFFNRYVTFIGDWNNNYLKLWISPEAVLWCNKNKREMNPYNLAPMFSERLTSVSGLREGKEGAILHYITRREREHIVLKLLERLEFEEEAVSYLKDHSLQEAMVDQDLPAEVREDILSLKTEELYKYFVCRGIQPPVLFACIDSTMQQAAFHRIDLEGLRCKMKTLYGVNWEDVLAEWFEQKRVPTYLVKRFQVRQVEEEMSREINRVVEDDIFSLNGKSKHRYRVNLEIYNDSDVDGVISLEDVQKDRMDDFRVFSGNCKQEIVELKAGEGKIIEWEYDDFNPKLDLGLSHNLPREYNWYFKSKVSGRVENTIRIAGREYFTGEGNPREIIVDNEDSTFRVREKRSFSLQDVFGRTTETYAGFGFPSERVWKRTIEKGRSWEVGLYGSPVATAMYKLAGDGECPASWHATIREEGAYEIWVYVAHLLSWGKRKTIKRMIDEDYKLTYNQYYTIKNGEEIYDVTAETNDEWRMKSDYWYLLGKYSLKPGTVEVILWDKSEMEEQVIVADAVKFVYVGK